jgi:hypothetical protein
MSEWDESKFREATGHSSLCNCVRRWRGRLIVTRRECDCKTLKATTKGKAAMTDIMTLQQKRRAMAEACQGIFVILPDGRILWRDTLGLVIEREWLYAVHLAERELGNGLLEKYESELKRAVLKAELSWVGGKTNSFNTAERHTFSATESQRIDSFLKVKGLWRDK